MTTEVSHWKQRAFAAEAHVSELDQSGKPSADHRFRRLRALLARELHPNHARTEGH